MKKFLLSLVAGTMLLGIPMIADASVLVAGDDFTGHSAVMTVRYAVRNVAGTALTYSSVRLVAGRAVANVDFVIGASTMVTPTPNVFNITGNLAALTSLLPLAAFDGTGVGAAAAPRGSTGYIELGSEALETNLLGTRLMGNATTSITLLKSAVALAPYTFTVDDPSLIAGGGAGNTATFAGSGDVVVIQAAATVTMVATAGAISDRAIMTVTGISPATCEVTKVVTTVPADTVDGFGSTVSLSAITATD